MQRSSIIGAKLCTLSAVRSGCPFCPSRWSLSACLTGPRNSAPARLANATATWGKWGLQFQSIKWGAANGHGTHDRPPQKVKGRVKWACSTRCTFTHAHRHTYTHWCTVNRKWCMQCVDVAGLKSFCRRINWGKLTLPMPSSGRVCVRNRKALVGLLSWKLVSVDHGNNLSFH